MSLLKVDEIRNSAGTGSPSLPFGLAGKTVTLADNESINIDSIFNSVADGEYLVMQKTNSQTFGVFIYTKGIPSSVSIYAGSTNFVLGDVDANLCLVVSSNDILLKNALGSQLDFTIHRRIV